MNEIFGEKIQEVPIEEELKRSYLDYAMSVIVSFTRVVSALRMTC